MKEQFLIFDYMDTIYNNEDPLIFLLRKNSYESIRNSFFMLNNMQRKILLDIIINERSKVDFAIRMDLSLESVNFLIDDTLELLFNLYKNTYNSN